MSYSQTRAVSCGKKINARCVDYEGSINDKSSLDSEGCLNIHDTTEDLYTQVEEIQQGIDLSGLGAKCLTFTPATTGDLKVKEALLTMEDFICNIKASLPDKTSPTYCPPVFTEDLSCLGLDFKCLVDPCGDPITTLKTLLQVMIDKTCECCD